MNDTRKDPIVPAPDYPAAWRVLEYINNRLTHARKLADGNPQGPASGAVYALRDVRRFLKKEFRL